MTKAPLAVRLARKRCDRGVKQKKQFETRDSQVSQAIVD